MWDCPDCEELDAVAVELEWDSDSRAYVCPRCDAEFEVVQTLRRVWVED